MEMQSPQGVTADLPPRLAQLVEQHGGWRPSDDPIPMTHIPGVVPGISMNRLKALVADGTIPHELKDRTKLIRPSDVVAALKAGK